MWKMAEESKISWTDATMNFWLGCTKVSPACDGCYAETWAKRAGMADLWQGRRQRTKTWGEPLKWQQRAKLWFGLHGRKRRVFTNSLADFFDNEVPDVWRDDAWAIIHQCPDLEWLIVTKRVSNVLKMIPTGGFTKEAYGHIIIIATVVTQAEADRDVPRLVAIKQQYPWVRIGLSIEPMLEPIKLSTGALSMLDWVIVGGESGSGSRAMPMAWVDDIAADCTYWRVPFHFKQVGHNHADWPGITGKGADPAEWPERFRVQEFAKDGAGA